MINDGQNIGLIDIAGQFGGIVGVDDDHRRVVIDVGNNFRRLKAPALRNESCFCIGRAEQSRLGGLALHLIEIPGPNDGASSTVGVGGFVAKNFDHNIILRRVLNLRSYRRRNSDCHPAKVGPLRAYAA